MSTTPADGSRAIWADDDDPRICRDTEPALAGGPVNAPAPDWTRMWNYWLGGKDHYPADRQAADQYADLCSGTVTVAGPAATSPPGWSAIWPARRTSAIFLDIGTGCPSRTPSTRSPSAPRPATSCTSATPTTTPWCSRTPARCSPARPTLSATSDADLNDPAALLAIARSQLGVTQPAAILLMTTLGHIGDPADDDDQAARAVVSALKDALLPSGYSPSATSPPPTRRRIRRSASSTRPAPSATWHAARNRSSACSTAWNSSALAWSRSTCGCLTPARSPPPRCPPGAQSPSISAPVSRHARPSPVNRK